MNKLLAAEFARLFRSFIFRLGVLSSIGFGVFVVLMRWLDVKHNPDEYAKLSVEYSNADGLLFLGGIYLTFVIAVFIGIFIGTEYSDGTIRNKLMVGHTRCDIYFSKLLVCAVADIIIYLFNLLTVLVLGNMLIHGTTMKATEILWFAAAGVTAMLAVTALLLLFSMLIQSKAVGAVVCLLVTMIMMFAALMIYQRLSAPEYYPSYTYIDEDTEEVVTVEKERNFQYLTGAKREVYEFLNNFIPTSQLYQIVMNTSDHLGLIMVLDCVIIMITTGSGVVVFKKKNLK